MAKKLILIVLAVLSLSMCFMLLACDNGNQNNVDKHQHTHVFSEEWLFDSTSHWHSAVCHDVTSEKEEHTFIENTCYVCGYNALTASDGDTSREVGLRCEDYLGDSNYKILKSVANVITDLKVYTKDHKPIVAIDSQALQNNKKIEKVTIGSNVLIIGQNAFSDCTALKEVVIENCAVTIQANAFKNCTSLTKITIGDSVISVGSDAFAGCTSLIEVNVVDLNGWCNIRFENTAANPLTYAKKLLLNGEEVNELVIANGLKKIGAYAFNNCTSITGIDLPDSIVSIGRDAFTGCDNLSNVNYNGDVGKWCEIYMYTRYSNPLIYSHKLKIKGEVVTDIVIPDGVQSICDFAFISCDNIKSVSLPNTVLLIGDGILLDCNPDSVIYRGSEEDWQYIGCGTQNDSWLDSVQFSA